MFHTGDLQSGISLAIAQSKLVACFVHSPSDTHSATWETWLNDDILIDSLSTKAVILRIQAESTEASFLAAFCPIAVTPTFVVIHNGTVLEKVEGGVEKEEFLKRVGNAMGVDVSGGEEERRTEAPAEQIQPAAQPSTSTALAQPSASSMTLAQPPAPVAADMSTLFPDRAARTAQQNAQIQAAEAEAKAARTAARRKEAEEAHAYHKDKGKGKASEGTDKGKEAARRDWMVQQSKAKQDAKAEKARILAQIEADRAERKARSQRAVAPVEVSDRVMSPSAESASRRTGAGGMCALQIRLFDGTSIKKRFEPTATLEKGVRDWIKSQEGVGDEPFTFKMLRAPLPSRNIEFGEEQQTLFDLGLTPNATLVLVPVQGYTDAYDSSGRGYVSSALNFAYGAASGATGILGRALTYVPGFGPSDEDVETSSSGPSEAMRPEGQEEGSARIQVKTLADQRAEAARKEGKKTEFYNGNSSAFEGRKDDDGADGKND